jgi:hypothetical protein
MFVDPRGRLLSQKSQLNDYSMEFEIVGQGYIEAVSNLKMN